MYRHGQLRLHTETNGIPWGKSKNLGKKSPSWLPKPAYMRSRSCTEEKHYPLLAAEIRQMTLLSFPFLSIWHSCAPQWKVEDYCCIRRKNMFPGKEQMPDDRERKKWNKIKVEKSTPSSIIRDEAHAYLIFPPPCLPVCQEVCL